MEGRACRLLPSPPPSLTLSWTSQRPRLAGEPVPLCFQQWSSHGLQGGRRLSHSSWGRSAPAASGPAVLTREKGGFGAIAVCSAWSLISSVFSRNSCRFLLHFFLIWCPSHPHLTLPFPAWGPPPHPSRLYTVVLFVCPDGCPEVCTRLLLLLPDWASCWGHARLQGSLPSRQPSFPVNPARSTRLTVPSPSA